MHCSQTGEAFLEKIEKIVCDQVHQIIQAEMCLFFKKTKVYLGAVRVKVYTVEMKHDFTIINPEVS